MSTRDRIPQFGSVLFWEVVTFENARSYRARMACSRVRFCRYGRKFWRRALCARTGSFASEKQMESVPERNPQIDIMDGAIWANFEMADFASAFAQAPYVCGRNCALCRPSTYGPFDTSARSDRCRFCSILIGRGPKVSVLQRRIFNTWEHAFAPHYQYVCFVDDAYRAAGIYPIQMSLVLFGRYHSIISLVSCHCGKR